MGVFSTHSLCGLIHALDAWSPAVIQEERVLPVVVVCLQDVPPAQLQINPEEQVGQTSVCDVQ